jgi:serine/threonine protein phosphatase PrpC
MTDLPLEQSGRSSFLEGLELDAAALSIAGPGARQNEDRYVFAAPGVPAAERSTAGYLFAVIDGMTQGGRGALAAQATAEVLCTTLEESRALKLRPDLLELKFHEANERIARETGGGCAATAIWIWQRQGERSLRAGWVHVGDTRLYVRRQDAWSLLTSDHSRGRFLLRHLGAESNLVVEQGILELDSGDWIALMSDGVWKCASPELAVGLHTDGDAAALTRELVSRARLNGSHDDLTTLIVKVDSTSDPCGA